MSKNQGGVSGSSRPGQGPGRRIKGAPESPGSGASPIDWDAFDVQVEEEARRGGVTNETNILWRQVKARARLARDRREQENLEMLLEDVQLGLVLASQLGEYHWRLWLPGVPERFVDYWPRTGKWYRPHGGARGIGYVAARMALQHP